MWSIFHCLARATFSLSYGSEDITALKWNRDVVHLDLKPDNSEVKHTEAHARVSN